MYTDQEWDQDNRDESGNCIHCGYEYDHSEDCNLYGIQA